MIERRTFLSSLCRSGLGAAALMAPFPLRAASGSVRKAPRLKQGDAISLVAPAGIIKDEAELSLITDTVRAMGLVPKVTGNPLARYGYLAGNDAERAAAINAAFADPDTKAVFAVRGGWGSARILPLIDFEIAAQRPKLLIGYSDITALHLALAAKGCPPSLHAPVGTSSWSGREWQSFRAIAFDGATPTYSNPVADEDRLVQRQWRIQTYGRGTARGRLIGGNLTVLSALVGTPYMPDMTGAILFLEDIDEAEYRIDRMLTQLKLAGILDAVAGIMFGQCSNCVDTSDTFGNFTVEEVLSQHLKPLGKPAFSGAAFGHIRGQYTLPVSVEAMIDADRGIIRILEPAVQ